MRRLPTRHCRLLQQLPLSLRHYRLFHQLPRALSPYRKLRMASSTQRRRPASRGIAALQPDSDTAHSEPMIPWITSPSRIPSTRASLPHARFDLCLASTMTTSTRCAHHPCLKRSLRRLQLPLLRGSPPVRMVTCMSPLLHWLRWVSSRRKQRASNRQQQRKANRHVRYCNIRRES